MSFKSDAEIRHIEDMDEEEQKAYEEWLALQDRKRITKIGSKRL